PYSSRAVLSSPFQPQDGIRHPLATVVQTCSLPIWRASGIERRGLVIHDRRGRQRVHALVCSMLEGGQIHERLEDRSRLSARLHGDRKGVGEVKGCSFLGRVASC